MCNRSHDELHQFCNLQSSSKQSVLCDRRNHLLQKFHACVFAWEAKEIPSSKAGIMLNRWSSSGHLPFREMMSNATRGKCDASFKHARSSIVSLYQQLYNQHTYNPSWRTRQQKSMSSSQHRTPNLKATYWANSSRHCGFTRSARKRCSSSGRHTA